MSDEAVEKDTEPRHLSRLWHVEMLHDGAWMSCTSQRRDPVDLMSVWDFRQDNSPDVKHRLVQLDVSVVDPESIRKLISEKAAEGDEAAVSSD